MRCIPILLAPLLWAAVGPAQAVEPPADDDRRDVVEVRGRRPVRGRVANPFAADELLVLQGGRRIRIPRRQVESIVTVNDHLRDVLRMHLVVPDDADRLWDLAAYARSKSLDATARLLAYRVLALAPQHEAAHQLLGHGRRGDEWLWRRGSRLLRKAAFDDYVADWGHPLEIRSEHWTLRTDAGVQNAVDALLDLERVYLHVHERFGAALDLFEILRPVLVLAWKDAASFPGWTGLRIPYYHPPFGGGQEAVHTFFAADAARPAALFRVAVEAILNRCLAVDATYVSFEDRLVDWFEIGFGQWVASQLDGPPGRAAPVAAAVSPQRAALVLDERRYALPILLTRNVDDNYYDSITDYKEMDWAYAELFVAFLMEDADQGGRADSLMRYATLAMRRKQGDSSRAFDKAFGVKIETLDEPFAAWLAAKAGR